MRKKENKLVVTFYTTTDAMAMEKACMENGFLGRLIPVPRQISADCGLAFCTVPEEGEGLLRFMEQCALRYQTVARCLL